MWMLFEFFAIMMMIIRLTHMILVWNGRWLNDLSRILSLTATITRNKAIRCGNMNHNARCECSTRKKEPVQMETEREREKWSFYSQFVYWQIYREMRRSVGWLDWDQWCRIDAHRHVDDGHAFVLTFERNCRGHGKLGMQPEHNSTGKMTPHQIKL